MFSFIKKWRGRHREMRRQHRKNQLILARMLASTIESDTKRQKTFVQIAGAEAEMEHDGEL